MNPTKAVVHVSYTEQKQQQHNIDECVTSGKLV